MTRAAAFAVLAVLASSAPASAAPPESPLVLPAFGTSLGRGPRVTARLTFDRRKAASGGFAFAARATTAKDAEAVRLSEAVLTTSGGLLSHAAVLARRHRVAAVTLTGRWTDGPVLEVQAPVFGAPSRTPEGVSFELVERSATARLAEGDIVTVDPAAGRVTLHGPREGAWELSLSEALRAYDGLGDPQALALWVEAEAPEPQGRRQAERLVSELSERVLSGLSPEAHLSLVLAAARKALPASERAALAKEAAPLFERLSSEGLSGIAEAQAALRRAGTRRAVERLEAEGAALGRRLEGLSAALGRPAPAGAARAVRELRALASKRLAALSDARDGELASAVAGAGASAPPRAVLPGSLYRRFVAEGGLGPLIESLSSDASLSLAKKSERIAQLFLTAGPTPGSPILAELAAAKPRGELLLVWVSTEAGKEVVPASDFEAGVRRAWASWWGPELLGRRKRRGLAQAEPEVTVQELVPAEVSGVLWTRDPVTRGRDRLVVEAAFGEGIGLSSGEAAADQHVVDPRTGRELLPALVADKRSQWVLDQRSGRAEKGVVPEGLSLRRCLDAGRLEQLARLARALEDHFGEAVEAEFCWSRGKLVVLAVRVLPSGR